MTTEQRTMTTEDLVDLIERYHNLKEERAEFETKRDSLYADLREKPRTCLSLDGMRLLSDRIAVKESDIKTLETQLRVIDHSIHYTLEALKNALPLSNIWVKAGKYGDTWGGWHTELSIRDWQEDLPELKDHTYYP